jgi:rubrerythrin
MSVFFNADEIFQFAIRIEENGEKFYGHATRITADDNAKKMFNDLAKEEINHRRIFEDLLSKMDKREPIESYPGEYSEYLRVFVDNTIFTDAALDKEISKVTDLPSALDFAIQRERDSLLYFHEIRRFVPKSHHDLIDKIIDEERKHFSKLSKLREKT